MRPALALTTLLALTCTPPQVPAPPPASPPVAAPAPPAPALHELELRRDSAPLLAHKDLTPELLLALARIGDRPARAALLAARRGDDPRQREHAARALGIAALLDADPTDLEPALLAAWPRADPDERIAIAEALGRLGTPAALPTLRAALDPENPPPLRSAAAIALGVLGRRKHPLDEPTRQALLRALEALGYPALYALANDPTPPPDPTILARLRTHAAATDPERQRLALAALARRSALPPLQACLTRELLGAARDPKHLDSLLGKDPTKAISTLLTWARTTLDAAHSDRDALLQARQLHAALNCLASESTVPTKPQRRALTELRDLLRPLLAATPHDLRQRTLARVDCQLAQRLAHDPAWRPPLVCGEPLIDPAERAIQQLIPLSHGFGGPSRIFALHESLDSDSPTLRIAAISALAPLWNHPQTASTVESSLLKALDDRTPGVLGTALDLIAAHHSATPRPPPLTAADPLWQRLAALAPALRDPELHSTLLAALAATRVRESLPLCEASRAHPSPAVRKSARTCITELAGMDPGPTDLSTPIAAPPFNPAEILDKTIVWTLTTHLGDLTIDLDPRAAPWAVAAIVDLTNRGFYNNLLFHRDVPGFVLQGGDPEGTGWGGPGFLLPSEPTNNPYTRGALGIADAGKDTGGSQFFFMYARAPHLEGRYTAIGRLRPEHLDRLDELTLGDRILNARVELTPR